MKAILLTLLATLFIAPLAQAETFSGSYQLLDSKGKVLFSRELTLNRSFIAVNKFKHVYREKTDQGVTITTLCEATLVLSKNDSRKITEICAESLIETQCIGSNCKGVAEFSNFLPGIKNSVIERNTSEERTQVITAAQPTDFRGLKNVKVYKHNLKRVK